MCGLSGEGKTENQLRGREVQKSPFIGLLSSLPHPCKPAVQIVLFSTSNTQEITLITFCSHFHSVSFIRWCTIVVMQNTEKLHFDCTVPLMSAPITDCWKIHLQPSSTVLFLAGPHTVCIISRAAPIQSTSAAHKPLTDRVLLHILHTCLGELNYSGTVQLLQ